MKHGYLRICDNGPSVEQQSQALLQHGCVRLFTDITQAGRGTQDGWQDIFNTVKTGDILVLTQLDRLATDLFTTIDQLTQLFQRGVDLQVLEDHSIDTTTQAGPAIKQTFQQLQIFAKQRLQARNKIGNNAARARGRQGGRPRKLDTKKIAMAKQLFRDNGNSITDICETLGISRATLYRYVKLNSG